MAILVMAQAPDKKKKDGGGANPTTSTFHEFFGASCAPRQRIDANTNNASTASGGGGHGLVSSTSDMGSERQMGNHFQGVPIHGLKSNFLGPETSNSLLGRKRSNSDSVFTGLTRDMIPQVGSESLESYHLMKMLRSSAGGELPRRSQDEELSFGMQPPKSDSTSHLVLQPPVGSRCDSVASKWENSLMNVGPSTQYHSRLGQLATYVDKVSARDSNAGPSILSPPAADEGSRTGIKGSGILSAINASNAIERSTPGVLISSRRPKSVHQSVDPEPSDSPRQSGINSASRQMTIFYAGQAHVFDEVHPNKADVIMALAGSNGGSWSTTYSPKSSVHPLLNETYIPNRDKGSGFSSVAFPQELRRNLSFPGNSIHEFNRSGRISTTFGDPQNTISGVRLGSMTLRPTRSLHQPVDPDTGGKREV